MVPHLASLGHYNDTTPRARLGPRSALSGGSRGARSINRAVASALERLREMDPPPRIAHQTGPQGLVEVESAYRDYPADSYELGSYFDDMAARFAADRLEGRRLRIRRLITIGTPHRGAVLAPANPLVEDRAVQDMYPGSLFLTRLDEAYRGDYPIVAYARLAVQHSRNRRA